MKKILLIAVLFLNFTCASAQPPTPSACWVYPYYHEFCAPATVTKQLAILADVNNGPATGWHDWWRATTTLSSGATFTGTIFMFGRSSFGTIRENHSFTFSTSGRYTSTTAFYWSDNMGSTWNYSFSVAGGGTPYTYCANPMDINAKKSNTDFSFTVNGKKYTGSNNGSDPTEIVLCNGEELKIDGVGGLGTYDRVETRLESDYENHGTSFWPLMSDFADVTSLLNSSGHIPLSSGYFSSFLYVAPVRYIKVTVKVFGPCDPAPGFTEKFMYFKVIDAAAYVDFEMVANACGAMTGVARQTTLPISDASFTTSPCIPGWQGGTSAGIVSFNTVGSTDPIISYNVRIEQVDPNTGAFIRLVSDDTQPGALPLNYIFGFPTGGYFNDPATYTFVSTGQRTFKATLTVNTAKCSNSNFSYFRIAAGNRNFKMTNKDEVSANSPILYPNPSTGKVIINYSNLDASTSIVLFDNLGKKVLSHENIGSNGGSFNIQNLANGIYFYTLTSGAEIFHGKLSKN